jgi:hypothetical protein
MSRPEGLPVRKGEEEVKKARSGYESVGRCSSERPRPRSKPCDDPG